MSNAAPKTSPTVSLEGLDMQMESKLTEEQKKILSFVYDSAKEAATEILNRAAVPDAMKITQLMGALIKMMESLTFHQTKIAGSTKKAVALELGRTLVRDLVKDVTLQSGILMVYDMTAEQTLELLVDVSHHVNVAMKEAAASCCEWMAECMKKK